MLLVILYSCLANRSVVLVVYHNIGLIMMMLAAFRSCRDTTLQPHNLPQVPTQVLNLDAEQQQPQLTSIENPQLQNRNEVALLLVE